jgi:poly-gamma-glutamate capsule biosynthesis protein CapA/YwtB (metallophosphatase superfamily)
MSAAVLDPATRSRLVRHVPEEDIPPAEDLFSPEELGPWLAAQGQGPLDLLAGGDVMLGGRAKPLFAAYGARYPFAALRPLLERARMVLANLEGPIARQAERQERRFSYRVAPATAPALAQAGIRLLTLANNHLMDCGREGVRETLEALREAGIAVVGAGLDRARAHAPAIVATPNGKIGVLGYYWNKRCAATGRLPGGAMDDLASLERDIPALRTQVDLLIVTSHWGVPYERVPGPEEVARARRAIELGADAVVGHHPHVVQPLEIYRGRPIFYSVGNLAFGSGNTKAEGILVGFRVEPAGLAIEVYALYVKNRDPRVGYQPKLLRGPSARRVLQRLGPVPGGAGARLVFDDARAVLHLSRPGDPRA